MVATCLRTVVGASKDMLFVRKLSLQHIFFSVSVKFYEDHETVSSVRYIWPPSILGMLLDLKQ